MGTPKIRLIETVLLSTHNICLGGKIRKIIFQYTLLSRVLKIESQKKRKGKRFAFTVLDKQVVRKIYLVSSD